MIDQHIHGRAMYLPFVRSSKNYILTKCTLTNGSSFNSSNNEVKLIVYTKYPKRYILEVIALNKNLVFYE